MSYYVVKVTRLKSHSKPTQLEQSGNETFHQGTVVQVSGYFLRQSALEKSICETAR